MYSGDPGSSNLIESERALRLTISDIKDCEGLFCCVILSSNYDVDIIY